MAMYRLHIYLKVNAPSTLNAAGTRNYGVISMTLRYDDICPPDMEPKDYRSYAEYLDMTLDRFAAAFKEAKLYTHLKNQIKLSKKLKDATKYPWLRKGKLVVVY